MLQQHGTDGAQVVACEVGLFLIAQGNHAGGTVLLVLLRDDIGDAQGHCAGTLTIGEDMQVLHVKALDKTVTVLKQFGRLATGTHHHVNTDKTVGHQLAATVHLVGKQLAVIVATHKFQNGVTTALQRNVEMGHESP